MELTEQFARNDVPAEGTALLNDFANGDLIAFEALFHQFQPEVRGWILRIVREPAIADDLTIETFWRIHRAHARFDPQRSFGAWARRIATNVALDHLKTRKIEFQLGPDAEIPRCAGAD